jgi:predicted MPP superfamily phosphohydrolase
MLFGGRDVADTALMVLALLAWPLTAWRLFSAEQRESWWFRGLSAATVLLLIAGIVSQREYFGLVESSRIAIWLRGVGLSWAFMLAGMGVTSVLFHPLEKLAPSNRRKFLSTASRVVVAAPAVITGIGLSRRASFEINELDIRFPHLPKDLDGLRIVQLTDIHLGTFLDRQELRRAVDMANELRAHVAVVTGDLISSYGDPLAEAVAEIARLKADAGIWGCHGNHEISARAEAAADRLGARHGVRFLRQAAAGLRFGNATLNLAGVDYQKIGFPYLQGMDKLIQQGSLNVLLSHNPDVFPVSSVQGFDLTLSGHTHGGQVNFEILDQRVNVARFITPYTRGLYRAGNSAIFVSSGIGTIGVPVRFGAPAEVSLIRLRGA